VNISSAISSSSLKLLRRFFADRYASRTIHYTGKDAIDARRDARDTYVTDVLRLEKG